MRHFLNPSPGALLSCFNLNLRRDPSLALGSLNPPPVLFFGLSQGLDFPAQLLLALSPPTRLFLSLMAQGF